MASTLTPDRSALWRPNTRTMEVRYMDLEAPSCETSRRALEQQQLVLALQKRSYHLPSNVTWCADWRQYLANNHPFYGLCCADPLSPIGMSHRFVALGTSILLGISTTYILIWWSLKNPTLQDDLFFILLSTDAAEHVEQGKDVFGVTKAMLFLWTWGSLLHAGHDCIVWVFFSSFQIWAYLLWMFVWTGVLIVFAGLITSEHPSDEQYDPVVALQYAAFEIFLSWFIWFPFVATILFSGVLGCFRLPVLGGRPRELCEASLYRG